MKGKFEIFQSEKNQQFYFRLKATNGQIILQSEGYTTKANCKNGIESVKRNASNDKAYVTTEKHFNLKSVENGKVIGSSQSYTSIETRDKGIKSVKENAPTADIIDLTAN